MELNPLILLFRISRPIFLLGAALLYAMGVGIARYLGSSIDWSIYVLGQVLVTSIQLGAHYLNEFFDTPADIDNNNRTLFSGGSGALEEGELPREIALWAAIGTFCAATMFTMLLMRSGSTSPVVYLIMVLIFLGAVFYSTPPVRLISTGYGELITSIIVANLVPALGFLLQWGELHRLVAMSTFPLIALHLAMMLTFELPDYIADLKHEKYTILLRLGWQRGMSLHNILILVAFLLLGLGMAFGFPTPIGLPTFFALPLGLFQIWYMTRIAAGYKPNWRLFTTMAAVLFGFTAYLLTFSFWTR